MSSHLGLIIGLTSHESAVPLYKTLYLGTLLFELMSLVTTVVVQFN